MGNWVPQIPDFKTRSTGDPKRLPKAWTFMVITANSDLALPVSPLLPAPSPKTGEAWDLGRSHALELKPPALWLLRLG